MKEKCYKWDPELYQKNSSYQFDLGIIAIERLNPKKNEHILEIGCGNGMVTIELAKRIPNGKITAVEISKEMIEQAKKNFMKFNISNVQIENLDALDMNWEDQFTAIFSNSAIHWIQDLKKIYEQICKTLIH